MNIECFINNMHSINVICMYIFLFATYIIIDRCVIIISLFVYFYYNDIISYILLTIMYDNKKMHHLKFE